MRFCLQAVGMAEEKQKEMKGLKDRGRLGGD